MKFADVIIIGAGAAGLMCAITAAKRGKKVVLLDHANKVGKKILMSGGGRCNFTNYDIQAENYLSQNPHFCKSALSRYTQWDFIALVEKHGILYHEKTLGQLFCDNKSKDILTMLLAECQDHQVSINTHCKIEKISQSDKGFELLTNQGRYQSKSLVIATGGLSIPKMGATGFGYQVAEQFGHTLVPKQAALVPFTLIESLKQELTQLSGTSLKAEVSCNGRSFVDDLLLTHRGLSGPVILQISSYWQQGSKITINLLPDLSSRDMMAEFEMHSSKHLQSILSGYFSKKLSLRLCQMWFQALMNKPVAEISQEDKIKIIQNLKHWSFKPNGTEGYRTAEVTKGGVNTDEVSSKTMQSLKAEGLFFIGEVIDVTGHLGGYNFQWAWSSGHAAGLYV